MQSVVLRRRLVGVGWWPLATLAGWAFAGALSGILPFTAGVTGRGIDIGPVGFVAVAALTVLATGFVSGVFQWLILRHQVDRSGLWVWTSTGGIALAVALAAAILGLMSAADWFQPEDFPSAQAWGVAGAVPGLAHGVVSGLALISLLRPIPAADPHRSNGIDPGHVNGMSTELHLGRSPPGAESRGRSVLPLVERSCREADVRLST
jgi:hypothetical protein